jgi:hypothetical protein
VLEPREGEQVEAGDARGAEQEQLQAAAFEPQRAPALEGPQQREKAESREELAQRRQMERVDVLDRGVGDREHGAPAEGRDEAGEEFR